MKGDDWMGIMIIVGIIAVALFGGVKGNGNSGLLSTQNPNPNTTQSQADLQYQVQQTQYQVDTLQKQVQAETDKQNNSKYFGLIHLRYVNRTTDPNQEYVSIQADYSVTDPILVTGWTVKSLATNVSMTIPKATYLYFSGMANSEDNVYLQKNDNLYLITGVSPVGASFKLNECSGYLNQFQSFIPYLNSSCPAPRDENLSSIPNTKINDECLDYINRFPTCRIQTDPLPANWSYECNNFIYSKINYNSCIDTHKNDKDFYLGDWRVYLKRTESIWKSTRETIVLYDDQGKVVDTLKY